MDPDPAISIIDLQDASKKLIFKQNFFCFLHFEGTFTSFFKDKMIKLIYKKGKSHILTNGRFSSSFVAE
jgi:hypothetical protein